MARPLYRQKLYYLSGDSPAEEEAFSAAARVLCFFFARAALRNID
jgi:hypothetical protein